MAQEGLLPCKDVVADCLYGNRPDLLDAVDACGGVPALVALAAETRGGLQRPQTADKSDQAKGAARSQRVGVGPEHAPRTVAAVAAPRPAACWYQRTVSEGDQGAHGVGLCPPPRAPL